MKIQTMFLIGAGLILLLGIVFAQPTGNPINLPSSFTMQLSPLPPQQSPNQVIHRCPYGELEFRRTTVLSINQTLQETKIKTNVEFWTNNRKSSCSILNEYNISRIAIGQVAVNELITEIDEHFQTEALANRQRNIERPIISTGSSG